VRANIPLVVFAGESPINAKFYNQAIDQGPIVHATGAHYVRAHSTTRMLDHVREAFYVARYERWPVVLGVPYDLQKLPFSGAPNYVPSSAFIPQTGHAPPNPQSIALLAEKLAAAQQPIIIAGRARSLPVRTPPSRNWRRRAARCSPPLSAGARHVRSQSLCNAVAGTFESVNTNRNGWVAGGGSPTNSCKIGTCSPNTSTGVFSP
jgi:hypothetical protein